MVVCDRDFWQFIKIILCVYILIDGSEIFNNIAPGTSFASRHHRGHPETWSGLERWDYTALMEVAHRTDLPADDAMERCAVVNTPGLLGRRRWRLFDGDVEIVGPIRRSVLAVRADESSARYMLQSRRGEIARMHTECWWAPLRAPSGLGQRLQLSKFLFDWWAVKLNQVKKGQTDDTEGARDEFCACDSLRAHNKNVYAASLKGRLLSPNKTPRCLFLGSLVLMRTGTGFFHIRYRLCHIRYRLCLPVYITGPRV
jgi:hypothetical protein